MREKNVQSKISFRAQNYSNNVFFSLIVVVIVVVVVVCNDDDDDFFASFHRIHLIFSFFFIFTIAIISLSSPNK